MNNTHGLAEKILATLVTKLSLLYGEVAYNSSVIEDIESILAEAMEEAKQETQRKCVEIGLSDIEAVKAAGLAEGRRLAYEECAKIAEQYHDVLEGDGIADKIRQRSRAVNGLD